MFEEKVMTALKELNPDTKEESLQLYLTQVKKIYFDVFKISFNQKSSQLKIPWKKIEDYFDEKNYAMTTRANYYSSLFNVFTALDYNKAITGQIKKMRDKYKQQYKDIDDGLKSQKQEDNFVSATLLNKFIDDYTKKIEDGTFTEGTTADDKHLLQVWMILKLLREYFFRNEIATLEFVRKKEYDASRKKDETDRNMIVMDKKGWFISKNKYKTQKLYGEEKIPIEGQMLTDLKFYYEINGAGMLFKSSFQKGGTRPTKMTPNALSKYLIKWSKNNIPPLVLEDGSKKARSLSTTMIVKAFQSAKQGATKTELKKDSKNRGNKPTTMMEVYVSTKEPEV